MSNEFNLLERWPELFEGLDEKEVKVLIDTFASSWHEGWEPNYEDVKLMTDYVKGKITQEEYFEITLAEARAVEARNQK